MITANCASLRIILLLFVVLDVVHLGNALKGNPGYLKLRRVRAAQLISNAVRVQNCTYKFIILIKTIFLVSFFIFFYGLLREGGGIIPPP